MVVDTLIRDRKIGDAAGKFAGVQPQGLHVCGQLEDGGHLVGQFVVGIGGHGQALPGRKTGPGIVKQLGQQQSAALVVGPVGSQHGFVVQHLLFQFQAPLCQPGNTFIGKLELLFQLGGTAAGRVQGRGDIVVHNRILLLR